MAEPIMNIRSHRPLGAAWVDSLPSRIGQDPADLLTGEWPLAEEVHRTSWRTVWGIFDEARADARFDLTEQEWDAAEDSLVAVGGVDSRDDLIEIEEDVDGN